MEKLIEIMKNQAANIVESNASIVLDDLNQKAALADGDGEIRVRVELKVAKMGNEYIVDTAAAWKVEQKRGDVLDTVSYNPMQPELFDDEK
jgi:hypothetical protein